MRRENKGLETRGGFGEDAFPVSLDRSPDESLHLGHLVFGDAKLDVISFYQFNYAIFQGCDYVNHAHAKLPRFDSPHLGLPEIEKLNRRVPLRILSRQLLRQGDVLKIQRILVALGRAFGIPVQGSRRG